MEGNLDNLVYFPFSIIAGIWLLVVIYGKCNHPKMRTRGMSNDQNLINVAFDSLSDMTREIGKTLFQSGGDCPLGLRRVCVIMH